MILQIFILIIGFVLLVKGADWLVAGSSSVASNFQVPKRLIGLTIVAIGTCAPELAVAFSSLAAGSADMLLGNVMGSNIINILLIIGVAAMISPIKIKQSTIAKELPLLLLISAAFLVLFLDINIAGAEANTFARNDAIICILLFTIFTYYVFSMIRKSRNSAEKIVEEPRWKLGMSFLFTILGLVGVIIGSQLVVDSASFIAAAIGVSDRIIALTIVAIGTSLPELVTTITAARKKENELLVGNIIGSNIFNICIVIGLPVATFGSVSPNNFEILDIAAMVGSAALLWLFAHRGAGDKSGRINRNEGFIMFAAFLIYYGYIIYSALT